MTFNPHLALRLAAIPLAALFAYAATQVLTAPTSQEAFQRGVGLIAATGLAIAAVAARPAVPITAGIVLGIFNPHWAYLGSSVALDRVALGLGVVSLLVREWWPRDGRLQTRPIDWLLMVASLFVIVSAWLAGELADSKARFDLLDRFALIPFLMFFLAPFAYREERDRRLLLAALVGIGLYLGTLAILESVGAREVVVPSYIGDETKGIHFDRARGPFLDGGPNGLVMYFCAVAGAMAFATWKRPAWRAVALLCAGLCLLGTVLTLTRAVWLAALVATPLTMILVRELRRYLVPAAVVALAIVAGALAVIPDLGERIEERRSEQRPVWDRQNSNAAALRMIRDNPVVGVGWDRFEEESKPYFRQSHEYPLTLIRELHNVFLSNAVELGLVGGGLWVAALLAGIGGAVLRRGPPTLRPWKVGLIAVATAMMLYGATAPLGTPLPWLLTWVWAGVAWGGRELDGA